MRGKAVDIAEHKEQALAIPDTVEGFLPYVFWPHISDVDSKGPVPVNTVNPMQVDFLKQRASFRVGDDGRPQGGRDIVVKSRRIRMSSLCFAMIIWAGLRFPGTRYVSVFQLKDPLILAEVRNQIIFALERLPRHWVGPPPYHTGWNFKIGNSRYDLATAGSSAAVASKVGRSGRIDGLHLSEVREYRYPIQLFSAAAKSVPPSGWILAETTPSSDPEHWHTVQYRLTQQGIGSFDRAHFWAWYIDPLKRVARGSTSFKRVMHNDFTKSIRTEDLLAERALVKDGLLDKEQVAFRRMERCTGTRLEQIQARAENPESLEDAATPAGDTWLLAEHLDNAAANVRDPVLSERAAPLLRCWYWVDPIEFAASDRAIVLGGDNAAFGGRDNKAIVVRDADTLEQVAQIHGKALDSECADAIVTLLDKLVKGRKHRYTCAIERNHAIGLIGELIRRNVALYCETVLEQTRGRKRKARRPGIVTGRASRPRFLSALAQGVEGSADSEPVIYRSSLLIDELRKLRDIDGKVQAGEGHDDLAMADAICQFVGRKETTRRGGGGTSLGPPQRHSRRLVPR